MESATRLSDDVDWQLVEQMRQTTLHPPRRKRILTEAERQAQRERRKAYRREWYRLHKKEQVERSKKWYRRNRKRALANASAYRQAHKQEIRDYARKYYSEHREKQLKNMREYYQRKKTQQ